MSVSVDPRLRLVQVLLHVLSLVTSLASSVSLGWSVRIFYDHCPLYTPVIIQTSTNRSVHVSGVTEWRGPAICYFCVFTATCGAILAIMWFWFYLLLSNFQASRDTQHRVPPDVRLLLPSLVVNVPLVVLALVVACVVTDGHAVFCAGVRSSFSSDCGLLARLPWSLPEDGSLGYQYMQLSLVFSWLWFLSLVATVVVVSVRIHRLVSESPEYRTFTLTSSRSGQLTSSSTSSSSSSDQLTSSMDDYSSADEELGL